MGTKDIDPKIWGPCAWWMLHTAAAKARTTGDLQMFKDMVRSLDCLLPCEKCRESFKRHLANSRWPSTAAGLPVWVYRLHNAINISIGDPSDVKKSGVLKLYSQQCNIEANQQDLVTKAAPFLAFLNNKRGECNKEKIRDFAEGLHHFFDTPAVPESALRGSSGFNKWLGITNVHVKSCSGTCTQKGGCSCD